MDGEIFPLLLWLHSSEICEHLFTECHWWDSQLSMRVLTNFPGIFAILFDFIINVETQDQYCTSLPQHSHAASCAPHARLAQPHVRSGSAPPQTAGTAIPWNTRGPATCSVRFRWSSGTAFRLNPVPPRTCRSRPSH
jgi:hypothetical protein